MHRLAVTQMEHLIQTNKPINPPRLVPTETKVHIWDFFRGTIALLFSTKHSLPLSIFKNLFNTSDQCISLIFQISRGRTQTGIPIMLARWTADEIRNLPFHLKHKKRKKERKKDRFKSQCWGAINVNSVFFFFLAESCWTFSLTYGAQSSCLFRVKGTEGVSAAFVCVPYSVNYMIRISPRSWVE